MVKTTTITELEGYYVFTVESVSIHAMDIVGAVGRYNVNVKYHRLENNITVTSAGKGDEAHMEIVRAHTRAQDFEEELVHV